MEELSMKKLLLINPVVSLGAYRVIRTKKLQMPPLALGYLAALTPDDWEIKIVDEWAGPVDPEEDADLVGITSLSNNVYRGYQLAEKFRERKIPVVMGGVHATMCPDEALQYVDTIVTGEAESVWKDLIIDFKNGSLKRKYHGELLPLDNLVLPRRDLFADVYESQPLQRNRGCPFACEFCSVSAFNGRKFRQRPVKEVLDEIETITTPAFFFLDDNLVGVGPKAEEEAMALFKGIIDRKVNKLWGSHVSINMADNKELIKYAYKSGCRLLYIGFESIELDNLKQMNKKVNIKAGIDHFAEKIAAFHEFGITVAGGFILGNDGDKPDIFDRTARFIEESGVDVIDLSILTPYPGTALYERLKKENRILYTNYPEDWCRYSSSEVSIIPKNLSMGELIRGYDRILQGRLNPPSKRFAQTLKTFFRTKSITSALLAHNVNKGLARTANAGG
jgi:radical SAM superfamily enzyme YgiQ (UPF0313 family)